MSFCNLKIEFIRPLHMIDFLFSGTKVIPPVNDDFQFERGPYRDAVFVTAGHVSLLLRKRGWSGIPKDALGRPAPFWWKNL
jgi:hypothetical protein